MQRQTIHVFGNITADIVPTGFVQGGALSYVGSVLKRLGWDVEGYSKGPEKSDSLPYFDTLRRRGITMHCLSPDETRFTEFENIVDEYLVRTQYCPYAPEPMTPGDFFRLGIALPKDSDCVLASVFNEISPELVYALAASGNRLLGIPQGPIRITDKNKRIWPHESPELLDTAHLFSLLVFSDEDVKGLDQSYVRELIKRPGATVMTRGEHGSSLYTPDAPDGVAFSPFRLSETELRRLHHADPFMRQLATTGLGDTFFAGLLVNPLPDTRTPVKWGERIPLASWVAAMKIRVALAAHRGGVEGTLTRDELGLLSKERL